MPTLNICMEKSFSSTTEKDIHQVLIQKKCVTDDMWVESNGLVFTEGLQFFRVQAFDKINYPIEVDRGIHPVTSTPTSYPST